MDWWFFTFFLGAILSLFLPIVPAIFQLFILLLIAVLFLYYRPLRTSSGLVFGALWILCGAWHYFQLERDVFQANHLYKAEFIKKIHRVQGTVVSLQTVLPNKESNDASTFVKINTSIYPKQRFNFDITHLNQQALSRPFIVRLNWKKAYFRVSQGQKLQLNVKLKPAHGIANLGAFNYKSWLNSHKITATGYVTNKQAKEITLKNTVVDEQISLRQTLFNRFQQQLSHHQTNEEQPLTPLMFALGFGERNLLTKSHWQVLQATGTGHLIAISGLHIGLVASGTFFLVMFVLRILPYLPRNLQILNIRYVAILISLFVALGYGYLAGFSLPTVRAILMLLLYWGSRFLSIRLSIKRWILLTVFLILLLNPFSLFTASFWLSVCAVAIIFFTLWRFNRYLKYGNSVWRFIKSLVIVQLSLTILLLPISALFFQQISTVTILANIVAVPWMSLFSIPLTLLCVLVMPISDSLTQLIISVNATLLSLIWQWLSFLANYQWAEVGMSFKQTTSMLFFAVIVLSFSVFPVLYLSVWQLIKRNCCTAFIISLVLYLLLVVEPNSLVAQSAVKDKDLGLIKTDHITPWQLTVFDVGQGLSVLITRNKHALLYDTGASYPGGFNMVDAAILPYLQREEIKQLDKVFISHGDNDHAGGLGQLQANISIAQLVTNIIRSKNTVSADDGCYQGKKYHWQGLTIDVLWPPKLEKKTGLKLKQGNDDSCVILLSDEKYNILLTGDISKKIEKKIIQQYPDLRANVLMVPHHGSKTSSSHAFIEQLTPSIALVSAGHLNRWDMPQKAVVQRYQRHNTKLFNTAKSGQIMVNFDKGTMQICTFRDNFRPFWFTK